MLALNRRLWPGQPPRHLSVAGCLVPFRWARARRGGLELLHASVGAEFRHIRGAQMFTEEIEKATNGELKVRLHLAGTLQISATNITQAVGDNVVQVGDDLFFSGNIPVAGIPRLPMLIQSYEDFAKADAVLKPYIEKAYAAKGSTLLASYTYPKQFIWGRKKISSLDDINGMKLRVAQPEQGEFVRQLRRHLDHDERAGSALGARPRRRRRYFHCRRRRSVVEGPAQIRLRPDHQRQQLLLHRQHRGLQQALARPAGASCARPPKNRRAGTRRR